VEAQKQVKCFIKRCKDILFSYSKAGIMVPSKSTVMFLYYTYTVSPFSKGKL